MAGALMALAACDSPEQADERDALVKELYETGGREHVVPFLSTCVDSLRAGAVDRDAFIALGYDVGQREFRDGSRYMHKELSDFALGSGIVVLDGRVSPSQCNLNSHYSLSDKALEENIDHMIRVKGYSGKARSGVFGDGKTLIQIRTFTKYPGRGLVNTVQLKRLR